MASFPQSISFRVVKQNEKFWNTLIEFVARPVIHDIIELSTAEFIPDLEFAGNTDP